MLGVRGKPLFCSRSRGAPRLVHGCLNAREVPPEKGDTAAQKTGHRSKMGYAGPVSMKSQRRGARGHLQRARAKSRRPLPDAAAPFELGACQAPGDQRPVRLEGAGPWRTSARARWARRTPRRRLCRQRQHSAAPFTRFLRTPALARPGPGGCARAGAGASPGSEIRPITVIEPHISALLLESLERLRSRLQVLGLAKRKAAPRPRLTAAPSCVCLKKERRKRMPVDEVVSA